MNHDRFPAPGQQWDETAPQYAPDPHNPNEAEIADFYAQPLTTPGEHMGQLPTIPGQENQTSGQLTGPMPERPIQQSQPHYEMPADIAAFHAQHAANYAQQPWQQPPQQQPPQPNWNQEGDYLLTPPTHEVVPQITVDPRRMGFRGLVGRLRNRVNR